MAPSEVLLLNHIRLVHSCDPNFSIQCSFPGCPRTFKNFRTYQNHRCCHRHQQIEESCTYEDDGLVEGEVETELSITPAVELPDLQPYAARWILKTRESRYLTRAATQGIIEDVQDLVSAISQSMEVQTHAVLRESGIDFDSVPNLKEVFSGPATKPFEGLASFHQQILYYRKHFNLVVSVFHPYLLLKHPYLLLKEPRRIILKETRIRQLSGRKRKVVVKKEEMMYIPLLETLQGLLNNSAILSKVTRKFLFC